MIKGGSIIRGEPRSRMRKEHQPGVHGNLQHIATGSLRRYRSRRGCPIGKRQTRTRRSRIPSVAPHVVPPPPPPDRPVHLCSATSDLPRPRYCSTFSVSLQGLMLRRTYRHAHAYQHRAMVPKAVQRASTRKGNTHHTHTHRVSQQADTWQDAGTNKGRNDCA